jgi:hypothetical protein
MNRFAAATIAAIITLLSLSDALSLDVKQTIEDWASASPAEKAQLAEMYGRVAGRLNVNVSAGEMAACINEVAAASSLKSQIIDEVAKACMLMIVSR